VVPGPGCQDTRRDRRAGLGSQDLFDRLRTANGGRLGGFFDLFAWRKPGEVRFNEAKVGKDRIGPTQRRFVEQALRFHRIEDFTIIEVAR
jgi:hypothetical protein